MTGDPLVSASWLAGELGQARLKVVDATWFMPGDPRNGRTEFETAHVPGAVFFDIDAVSDRSSPLPHMLPAPEALAQALAELGLSRGDRVVVYDAQGVFSAPRVWWTLRAAGFKQVFVLDGGLRAWLAAGRPVETGSGSPSPVAAADAIFEENLVRNLEQMRSLSQDGGAQIVDARPTARFLGEAPEPRPGLRSGHMPGALNLPWQALIAEDGRMRPAAELREAFEAAGVDLSAPIVTTCGSGVSAALLALALARLGIDQVPVYDGSWSEWGGRADTPVATGS